MFVVVGRFHFRPMGQDEQQSMMQLWERDFVPMVRESRGFRSVRFVQLSDEEMMTDWHWDSEADWDAAQARFGPFLQQHVAPNLAQPPERVGGEVVLEVAP
jgi:heme-degrading monooxygenase HmoA